MGGIYKIACPQILILCTYICCESSNVHTVYTACTQVQYDLENSREECSILETCNSHKEREGERERASFQG